MAIDNIFELEHYNRYSGYEGQINDLYFNAISEASQLANGIKLGDIPFAFKDNPKLKARIDTILSELQAGVTTLVASGIDEEWKFANDKNNDLVSDYLGEHAEKDAYKSYFNNHDTARDAFKTRQVGGLDLSQRVWKYTDQFKEELEMGLDLGIREGKSAAAISRDVRQYLEAPEQLFRRFRNEHGQLELSKKAKAWNPGQGVYRSSYKNALRLAATETNIAYRSADFERVQDLDFVVGIEVCLSNNHPVRDICDTLNGVYPKEFKFTGWHPWCRCYTKTILQEFDDFLEGKKVKPIEDINQNLTDWIDDNTEGIKRAANLPYFLNDNKSLLPQLNNLKQYTASERRFLRRTSTKEALERMDTEFYRNAYPDVSTVELSAIHHYTRSNLMAYRKLNSQLTSGSLDDFNKEFYAQMRSGLNKLPSEEGIVYRGSVLSQSVVDDYISALESNKPYTHKFFTSASEDAAIANEFTNIRKLKSGESRVLFEIEAKKCKKIGDISEFNGKFVKQNQKEVIFDINTQFRVEDHYMNNDTHVFIITEL